MNTNLPELIQLSEQQTQAVISAVEWAIANRAPLIISDGEDAYQHPPVVLVIKRSETLWAMPPDGQPQREAINA
jgi:hypothetical protein